MTLAGPPMISPIGRIDLAAVMWSVLQVVLLGLLLMLLLVVLRRLTVTMREQRRDRLARQTRPLLLEVMAGDTEDPETLAAIAGLPERQWRVLEPTLVGMLAKVRGGARDALVEILARRGTLDRAERQARSRSWVRRCQAAEMLGATRRRASLPVLVGMLDDRNPDVRRVAVRALGRLGTADVVEPLLAATAGERPLPLRDVATSLVLLDPAATGAIVASATRSGDSRVHTVAAEVLGLRGAVEASRLLVGWLEQRDDLEVRIRAARALGRIGVPSAVAPLVDALGSPSPELRAVAARALGQLGATAAVGPLRERLGDERHRVAANAASSLAALGNEGRQALRRSAEADDTRAASHAREALAMHDLGWRALDRMGA